ncbi:hypothetical protein AAE478_005711 [Parahypoxylon ruwenzoriense]
MSVGISPSISKQEFRWNLYVQNHILIHIIRHAEGLHNVSTIGINTRDPYLTTNGIRQCAELQKAFPYMDKLAWVAASPMKRTIQTAALTFAPYIGAGPGHPILLVADLHESGNYPCNMGSPISELSREFGRLIDFRAYVGQNWFVKGSDADLPRVLTQRGIRARTIIRNIIHLCDSDCHIAVVTHGNFIPYLTGDYSDAGVSRGTRFWRNTEWRSYQFVDETLQDPNAALRETDESLQRHGAAKSNYAGRDAIRGMAYINEAIVVVP